MMRSDFRNVFTYWNGNEYPLIKILRDTMIKHSSNGIGYELILIQPNNLTEYIDKIPECFNDLSYAHQADYVRVYAVNKYGGIWLDADTIVMESLDSLFSIICQVTHGQQTDGFFIREDSNTICNGVFGSKPGTKLTKMWLEEMTKKLETKKHMIGWTEIGNTILNDISSQTTLFSQYKIFNGNENMYPVHYSDCFKEWITKPYKNYNKLIRQFQPLIILVNTVYSSDVMKSKNVEEIMRSMMPINYFINKSLGMSEDKIKRQTTFQNIYDKQIWNNGNSSVPRSGPGSALENTGSVISFLDKFIIDKNIKSICDIGCGDLTWIQKTSFFQNQMIMYKGYDIVPSVINDNKNKFPNKIFDIVDAVNDIYTLKNHKCELVIVRDIIFHMKNEEIMKLFKNINNTFTFICITSSRVNKNLDTFDQWHFSPKNIKCEPFKIGNNHECVLDEYIFNRQMFIYHHDKFYN